MKKLAIILLLTIGVSNIFAIENHHNKLGTLGHLALAVPTVINTYNYMNIDKIFKTKFTLITDEKIVKLARKESQKIISQEINLYTGNASFFRLLNKGYFAVAIGNNNILIEPDYYEMIKTYINDESKEDRNIVLNIFKFIIQHETGHIKNHDSRNRCIRKVCSCAMKAILFETSRRKINCNATFWKASWKTLGLVEALNIIDDLIQISFNRKQEFLADKGIVGQDAIQGGKQFFANLNNIRKNNKEIDIAMKMDPQHPSTAKRLEALQKLFPVTASDN